MVLVRDAVGLSWKVLGSGWNAYIGAIVSPVSLDQCAQVYAFIYEFGRYVRILRSCSDQCLYWLTFLIGAADRQYADHPILVEVV